MPQSGLTKWLILEAFQMSSIGSMEASKIYHSNPNLECLPHLGYSWSCESFAVELLEDIEPIRL